jgi:hypothetical protein
MATATHVQMVTDKELADIETTPSSISKLNQPADKTYTTHYACSINYFLTGSAWGEEHPLAAMLSGKEQVNTPALENGQFGVVRPKHVAKLAELLSRVDTKKLRARVNKADWDELADEEVLDAEILQESDDPAGELLGDVERLAAFYADADKKKLGVVMYTT